jgi:hypothetical protein
MKKNPQIICSCLLIQCVLFLSSSTLNAQISVQSVDSVTKFQAIPNDLAFQMLGLPGNNIQQPGTVSNFLASVQPAVNLKGNLSPGLAISFAPYQLLMGNKLQLHDYVADGWTRLLSNSQLSLGTAPTRNADTSQDWGIGARFVILNSGDGRLDSSYINLLVQSAKEVFEATPLPPVGGKVTPQFLKINGAAFIISAKIKALIPTDKSITHLQKTLSPLLDSLSVLSDQLEDSAVVNGNYTDEAATMRDFVAKYRDPKNLTAIQKLYTKLIDARSTIANIQQNGDSPGWNTTTLDLNVGTVYRAVGTNARQSEFSKIQLWLNGGVGLGSSQLLAQIGYYRQYALPGRADSSYLTSAVMFRYGNQDLRFGLGGNGIGFEQGAINLVAEIRISTKTWIVASFNRDVAKGTAPTWSPGITVKTSGGMLGL